MKRLFALILGTMIVLGLVTSANALLLSAGESATFCFDFSSDTVVPPYDGYHLSLLVDAFVDPITGYGKMSFYGMDLSGHWRYPSPTDGEVGGFLWSVYDEFDVGIDIATVGFHDENFTNEAIQYIKVWVEFGSTNIDQIQLSMIVRGESGEVSRTTGAMNGSLVPTAPVPEPATMSLLGGGLLALVFYGRKKFNN